MSKCEKHGVDHIKQDVGWGKWIPLCPECETERKSRLASMFAPEPTFEVECFCGNRYSLHMATVCPRCFRAPSASGHGFHAACGTFHDLSICPVGAPEAEVERKDQDGK